jgi:hypothetical protein
VLGYQRFGRHVSSLHPEDGGSKVLRNIGIPTRYHNPEDLDLYQELVRMTSRSVCDEHVNEEIFLKFILHFHELFKNTVKELKRR